MDLSRIATLSEMTFTSAFTSAGVVAEPARTKEVRTMKNAEENFISGLWARCCRNSSVSLSFIVVSGIRAGHLALAALTRSVPNASKQDTSFVVDRKVEHRIVVAEASKN